MAGFAGVAVLVLAVAAGDGAQPGSQIARQLDSQDTQEFYFAGAAGAGSMFRIAEMRQAFPLLTNTNDVHMLRAAAPSVPAML